MHIRTLAQHLSVNARLLMLDSLFFVLRGKSVRIGGCRFGFLSDRRDYKWVDAQMTAVHEALRLLDDEQEHGYRLRFAAYAKSYVFFNGTSFKQPEVLLGGHTLVTYKAGTTDNALVLAKNFVYFARCVELSANAVSEDDIDWFKARQDQFAFLSLHSEWLPTLRWLWRDVKASHPDEATRLTKIWDVRWGSLDEADRSPAGTGGIGG